jgi:DNA (cytosine-5)-methyltransferase 1
VFQVLDLFSGIGGFSLGLERTGGFKTVAFCEIEDFPRRVLKKHWPDVPIYTDVRELNAQRLADDGIIPDIITGGFPCQPWSVAGEQRGAEDDRDLWPAMVALVEKLRPKFLIGENVRGFVNEPLGLQRSLSDLARIGYEAVPFVIPACAVDAPHRRDRVWIVANAQRERGQGRMLHAGTELQTSTGRAPDTFSTGSTRPEVVADSFCEGLEGQSGELDVRGNQPGRQREEEGGPAAESGLREGPGEAWRWLPEPRICRVAHGIPNRVHRLKALGNAVVPQVVEQIGRAILDVEIQKH